MFSEIFHRNHSRAFTQLFLRIFSKAYLGASPGIPTGIAPEILSHVSTGMLSENLSRILHGYFRKIYPKIFLKKILNKLLQWLSDEFLQVFLQQIHQTFLLGFFQKFLLEMHSRVVSKIFTWILLEVFVFQFFDFFQKFLLVILLKFLRRYIPNFSKRFFQKLFHWVLANDWKYVDQRNSALLVMKIELFILFCPTLVDKVVLWKVDVISYHKKNTDHGQPNHKKIRLKTIDQFFSWKKKRRAESNKSFNFKLNSVKFNLTLSAKIPVLPLRFLLKFLWNSSKILKIPSKILQRFLQDFCWEISSEIRAQIAPVVPSQMSPGIPLKISIRNCFRYSSRDLSSSSRNCTKHILRIFERIPKEISKEIPVGLLEEIPPTLVVISLDIPKWKS